MVNVPLKSELKLNKTESVSSTRDTSIADAITKGTLTLLHAHGWAALREVSLANNRRVDIMAINHKGEILVVEVKSGLADFASDAKWEEYLDFCDYFYFAVDENFAIEALPECVGKIVADGFGGAFVQDSELDKLPPARRKALTVKFARSAAFLCYQLSRKNVHNP